MKVVLLNAPEVRALASFGRVRLVRPAQPQPWIESGDLVVWSDHPAHAFEPHCPVYWWYYGDDPPRGIVDAAPWRNDEGVLLTWTDAALGDEFLTGIFGFSRFARVGKVAFRRLERSDGDGAPLYVFEATLEAESESDAV